MALLEPAPARKSHLRKFLVVATLCVATLVLFSASQFGNALPRIIPTTTSGTSAASSYIDPPTFTPGIPKPHWNYRKGVVIASIASENTDWTTQLPRNIDVYRYVNDDPTANLSVPANKGREVMSYLTFLIDHYDNLPDVTIFVHAHEATNHNPWIFNQSAPAMIRALSARAHRVIREGFMNMHCGQYDSTSCPALIRPKAAMPSRMYRDIWKAIYPQYEIPDVLAQHCCGQFAVSRERALQIPREEFIRLRTWLLDTGLRMGVLGHMWEYLWQFIFTGHHVLCPESSQCYCDGYGYCFGGHDEWTDVNNMYVATQKLYMERKRIKDGLEEGEQYTPEEMWQRIEMDDVRQHIDSLIWPVVNRARERGEDPRIRAEESNRKWKEGGGF